LNTNVKRRALPGGTPPVVTYSRLPSAETAQSRSVEDADFDLTATEIPLVAAPDSADPIGAAREPRLAFDAPDRTVDAGGDIFAERRRSKSIWFALAAVIALVAGAAILAASFKTATSLKANPPSATSEPAAAPAKLDAAVAPEAVAPPIREIPLSGNQKPAPMSPDQRPAPASADQGPAPAVATIPPAPRTHASAPAPVEASKTPLPTPTAKSVEAPVAKELGAPPSSLGTLKPEPADDSFLKTIEQALVAAPKPSDQSAAGLSSAPPAPLGPPPAPTNAGPLDVPPDAGAPVPPEPIPNVAPAEKFPSPWHWPWSAGQN
jgi:hypothetical protein